jgi:hypothetical protein
MQTHNQKQQSSELTTMLLIVSIISLLELLYCIIALLNIQSASSIPTWRMLVYSAWFAISITCTFSMIRGKRWGVYLLAIATLLVTVVDIAVHAPMEGLILGIFVIFLLGAYLSQSEARAE